MNKKFKVLLVEDNYMNRRIMTRLLESLSLVVDTAEDAKETLEKVKTSTYDLILMDYLLPGKNGCDIVGDFSDMKLNTVVIAVTASEEPGIKQHLIECGFQDVINKPLQQEDVLYILENYVDTSFTQYKCFDKDELEKAYDVELRKEIIQTFLDEHESDIKRIKEAYLSKDIDAVYKALHYMKGSFSYLKAKTILDFTQDILDKIKVDDTSDLFDKEKSVYDKYLSLYEELKFYMTTI
jgi:CheY-like chemotaxis protein